MRLLEGSGGVNYNLRKKPFEVSDPPYAILSHTWRADDEEEVTFQDLLAGTGTSKPGYEKIQFCGEQAQRDGLHYFWVDTCCIDKTNNVELQEAITSMYRWYQNADKCYVYLTDVSCPTDEVGQRAWESDFRSSRWFRRGWTLQELLAPASVEFFSRERTRLGDKRTLEHLIIEITKIPARALRDPTASRYSIQEILAWQQRRETKRQEDKAYSLLGICKVYMPLIYGEGAESAFRRLRKELQDSGTSNIFLDLTSGQ
jgi:Heterokaryon incompatibility protein (HET)